VSPQNIVTTNVLIAAEPSKTSRNLLFFFFTPPETPHLLKNPGCGVVACKASANPVSSVLADGTSQKGGCWAPLGTNTLGCACAEKRCHWGAWGLWKPCYEGWFSSWVYFSTGAPSPCCLMTYCSRMYRASHFLLCTVVAYFSR
jgi:hypothetical protein